MTTSIWLLEDAGGRPSASKRAKTATVQDTHSSLKALDLAEEPGNVYYAVSRCLSLWQTELRDALTSIAPHKFPNCLPVLTLYARGCISVGDTDMGCELLLGLAHRQHGPASHLLGLQKLDLQKPGEGDVAKALDHFNDAIAHGAQVGPTACYLLGRRSHDWKIFDQAGYWWKQGAELGEPRCQANYALLLYHGRGIATDRALSLQWREKAADAGIESAARSVGIIYYKQGDYAKARKYLAMVVDDEFAHYYLGLCHSHGHGGAPDKEKAAHHLRLAAERGHPKAKALLDRL